MSRHKHPREFEPAPTPRDALAAHWDEAFDRFEALVERTPRLEGDPKPPPGERRK